MRIVAIIPARMAANRFPGKPLALILGLPMIEHVRRRASLCDTLDEVIVATCDEAIREVVEEAGGRVIMTSDVHERCTDRIAEAAILANGDIVINVQGDEPLVMPNMMDEVIQPLLEDCELLTVNLVARIANQEEFDDSNTCKVVTNRVGDLLYISREPIPSQKKAATSDYIRLKQLGIIAFRNDFLQIFTKLEPTPLEQIESVDMMRAVEHGYRVKIVETNNRLIGVDVPEDIERVEKILATDPLIKRYL